MQSFTCNLKQAENMVTNSMEFLPKNDDEDEDEKNRKKVAKIKQIPYVLNS